MTERTCRRHSPSNSPRISDAYLSALTRTFHVPASRGPGPERRETCEPGETFEEVYPRFPFAILTRAALSLTGWLTSRRATEANPKRPGERASW